MGFSPGTPLVNAPATASWERLCPARIFFRAVRPRDPEGNHWTDELRARAGGTPAFPGRRARASGSVGGGTPDSVRSVREQEVSIPGRRAQERSRETCLAKSPQRTCLVSEWSCLAFVNPRIWGAGGARMMERRPPCASEHGAGGRSGPAPAVRRGRRLGGSSARRRRPSAGSVEPTATRAVARTSRRTPRTRSRAALGGPLPPGTGRRRPCRLPPAFPYAYVGESHRPSTISGPVQSLDMEQPP